jgi:16S rRNA (cytidine1402-2'-O)-methyltransferase
MVKSSATSRGILYVVATPIGNRKDISARALHTLNEVDGILAEDTRHSLQLLTNLGIKKPLFSFHAHNETEKSLHIIKMLEEGKSLALISDAGTPLISDPGFPLVRLARDRNISVVPVPGPCALIAALSVAGVPCDSFTFAGFLPAKQVARKQKLQSFLHSEHTVIFYESTHRICEGIADIGAVFGQDYELVMAKELTKAHEYLSQGTASHILAWLKEDSAHLKGEFVLILPPRPQPKSQGQGREILSILLQELPLKQAVQVAFLITKLNKNELYKIALHLQEKD